MNGKVLDIAGAKTSAGAKVIMYEKKDSGDADNQLWFEDRYGNIRSKLNPSLVLDGSGKFCIFYTFPLILGTSVARLTKMRQYNVSVMPEKQSFTISFFLQNSIVIS